MIQLHLSKLFLHVNVSPTWLAVSIEGQISNDVSTSNVWNVYPLNYMFYLRCSRIRRNRKEGLCGARDGEKGMSGPK